MTDALPPATPVPSDARPLGQPPYADAGEPLLWLYRSPDWTPVRPQHVTPVRVVREDERGLAVWLAERTVYLQPRDRDGAGGHDKPLDRRFLASRREQQVSARLRWQGLGILRLAPVARPWSAWLFWNEQPRDAREFAGWYVNLENPHVRTAGAVLSSDHILDICIGSDGTVTWKDEDEIAASVPQGRYTAAQAATIRAQGEQAIDDFRSGSWPFDEEWTRWTPPNDWTVPTLPREATWQIDLLDA